MELLPESQVEGDEVLQNFTSEDGKHFVVWRGTHWFCIDHEADYYEVCAQEE